MAADARIADHYETGDLLADIEAGLGTAGVSLSEVTIDDLAPVDEFHAGGRVATADICEKIGLTTNNEILDVGCGIGGPARFMATASGCRVTGVDLTPGYIDVARALTKWVSLEELVTFEVGSALDLPFPDSSFDAATQLHVGMNISDKEPLFAEVNRVLRPGGSFGVYDILRTSDADPMFPVPWATDASMSFVDDVATYHRALEAAGFVITDERDRRDMVLEFFAAMKQRTVERGGPSPLGLHLVMGPDGPTKITNMVAAITEGTLSPVEIICRRSRD